MPTEKQSEVTKVEDASPPRSPDHSDAREPHVWVPEKAKEIKGAGITTIYSNGQPVEVTPPEAAQATQEPRGDPDDYTAVPGKTVKVMHIMPEGCCAVPRGLLEDVLGYFQLFEEYGYKMPTMIRQLEEAAHDCRMSAT